MDIADELIEKVKAAAGAPLRPLSSIDAGAPDQVLAPDAPRGNVDIVVMGISTGGPQGLKVVIPQLPAELSGADCDGDAYADRVYGNVRTAT